MSRALVKKEFKQHFSALVVLLIISVLTFLVILLGNAADLNKTNPFEVLSTFLTIFTPLIAIILCRRLVVIEYSKRTHFFLESLPVSRLDCFLTKYLFGLGIILIITGGITGSCLFYGYFTNHSDLLFGSIISLRAFLFIFFVYNFFFTMAYSGRYRFIIYIFLFLVYFYLDYNSNMEIGRIGPFALLNKTFPYERFSFPIRDGIITLVGALILLITALLFGLASEGSLVTLFSSKMSHKEKIIFAMIFLLGFISLATFDVIKEREPFDITGVNQASGDGVIIKIAGDSGHSSFYQDLAEYLHEDFVLIRKYLGIESLEPIFIIQNESLLPMIHKPVQLEETDGNLFYTNMNHPEWNKTQFKSFLIYMVLLDHTGYQAGKEKNVWVLEGFSKYWGNRREQNDQLLELQAAYGIDEKLSQQTFNNWFSNERRVGSDISGSVAWSGINLLKKRYPEDQIRNFLQIILGKSHPRDIRGVFSSKSSNVKRTFNKAFKSDYSDFINDWFAYAKDLSASNKKKLDKIPGIDANLDIINVSENSRSVWLNITNSGYKTIPKIQFYCFYNKLSGIQNYSYTPNMKYLEDYIEEDKRYEFPVYYSPGERLDFFVLLYSEKLGCYISSPAKIKEIE